MNGLGHRLMRALKKIGTSVTGEEKSRMIFGGWSLNECVDDLKDFRTWWMRLGLSTLHGALILVLSVLGDWRVGVRRSCNSRLTPTYMDERRSVGWISLRIHQIVLTILPPPFSSWRCDQQFSQKNQRHLQS